MTFEEYFPSLIFYPLTMKRIKRIDGKSLPQAKMVMNDSDIRNVEIHHGIILNEEFLEIPIKDLQAHCLDKKKVRDVIKKLRQSDGNYPGESIIYIAELEKELGL